MLTRPHRTLNRRQSARLTLNRSELSAALAAIQREIAAAQEGDPVFFAEVQSSKYSAKIRHEEQSVIVSLKHPPPGEISIFEFAIEDSGTIARSGRLLSPTKEPSDFWSRIGIEDYKRMRMRVARIKALAGRASYLETVLGYGVTPRPQANKRPEPTSPAQAPASNPKTDEAPRESTPEVRPPSQPPEVTTSREHTREEKRQKGGGRKPNKTISDRNKEIATLAATGKTTLKIAKHLDARRFSVPDSWTIEESDGNSYTVRNFEKAYHAPHLRKKLIGLIYDAKRCSRAIG